MPFQEIGDFVPKPQGGHMLSRRSENMLLGHQFGDFGLASAPVCPQMLCIPASKSR